MEEENGKGSSKKEVYNFFACLVMVVIDLGGRPHFFNGAVVGLAISGALLMGREIVVGFFELFL